MTTVEGHGKWSSRRVPGTLHGWEIPYAKAGGRPCRCSPLSFSRCSRAGQEEAGLEDRRALGSAPAGGCHLPHLVFFFPFYPSLIHPLSESTALFISAHPTPKFSPPDPRPAPQVASFGLGPSSHRQGFQLFPDLWLCPPRPSPPCLSPSSCLSWHPVVPLLAPSLPCLSSSSSAASSQPEAITWAAGWGAVPHTLRNAALGEKIKVGKLARILETHHEESAMTMQSPIMGSDTLGAPSVASFNKG